MDNRELLVLNDETYLLSIEKIAEDYREGFVGNNYPSNIENDSNSKSPRVKNLFASQ